MDPALEPQCSSEAGFENQNLVQGQAWHFAEGKTNPKKESDLLKVT